MEPDRRIAERVRSPLFESLQRLVPVVEAHQTQLAPGDFSVRSDLASARGVWLMKTQIEPLSVSFTLPDPRILAFLIPVRWTGEYRVNGRPAAATTLFINSGLDGYVGRAAQREFINVAVGRDRFVAAVASLDGVTPDEVRLHDGVLTLSGPHMAALRRFLAERLGDLLGRHASLWAGAQEEAADEVFHVMLDAYMRGRPPPPPGPARDVTPEQIVRRVEDRFEQSAGRAVSLAELCAAAGVGRTALHGAFRSLIGEPPLTYLRNRRLMLARTKLILAEPDHASVKRIALDLGLFHLGRFSRDYRNMFGETPTMTIRRRHSADPEGSGIAPPNDMSER